MIDTRGMAWHLKQTFRCSQLAFSLMTRLWTVQQISHLSSDAVPLVKIQRNGSFNSVKFEKILSFRSNPKLMKVAFCLARVVQMKLRISISEYTTQESEPRDPIVLGPLRESSTKVQALKSHPERWPCVSTKD